MDGDVYVIFALETVWYLLMFMYMGVFFITNASDEYKPVVNNERKPDEMTFKQTLYESTPIRDLILFLIFIYSIPDSGQSIMYFFIGPAGYTPALMGNISFISNIFGLLGSQLMISNIKHLSMFYATCGNLVNIPMILIVSRTSMYYVDDIIVSYITSAFMSFVVNSVNVSFITAASKAAPSGSEGGAFSTYVTLPLIGNAIGAALTYWMTIHFQIDHHNFEYLSLFTFICSCVFLCTLIPPFFIRT
jgi:hypothetical protein